MDKQDRLTKLDEWELGAKYDFVKGNRVVPQGECTEIEPRGRFIKIEGVPTFAWRNRYRKRSDNPLKK